MDDIVSGKYEFHFIHCQHCIAMDYQETVGRKIMVLLDHAIAHNIITDISFWAVIVPLFVGIIGTYIRYTNKINILCVQIDNQETKFDARIDNLKEQTLIDKKSSIGNHEKLYNLCQTMNERLSRIEGALSKK